jgi:hypothetical protein
MVWKGEYSDFQKGKAVEYCVVQMDIFVIAFLNEMLLYILNATLLR